MDGALEFNNKAVQLGPFKVLFERFKMYYFSEDRVVAAL